MKCKFIVLTGGPGAGKTAVLEILKKNLCPHIAVLPEAAGIVFGGGFWRRPELASRKAAQRAIYFVQRELENLVKDCGQYSVALCDRGTVDGLAYWPNSDETFWKELKTSTQEEFKRYSLVIHLRTPPAEQGYNHANPLRTETPAEASIIDKKIESVWATHPNRVFVESSADFVEKARKALDLVIAELPEDCRAHLKHYF